MPTLIAMFAPIPYGRIILKDFIQYSIFHINRIRYSSIRKMRALNRCLHLQPRLRLNGSRFEYEFLQTKGVRQGLTLQFTGRNAWEGTWHVGNHVMDNWIDKVGWLVMGRRFRDFHVSALVDTLTTTVPGSIFLTILLVMR
jgi:hypothetical protein